MSETVLVNVMVEIIKRINEAQRAVGDAMTVLPDEGLKSELAAIYDELGVIAERVVKVLGGNGHE